MAVAVDRLTFAYGPHADPVLVDLSLTLAPGDHLAVIGASGIGKSTLANLLAGLEPHAPARSDSMACPHTTSMTGPGRGESPWCRRRPTCSPAPSWPISPICGPTSADPMWTRRSGGSARTALVARLGGLDSEITAPATQLSSGERQILVLVRVYLSDARLVILDEAACHLDPAAEAHVEAAFAARTGTLVVIAHRLASATRAQSGAVGRG